MFSKELPSPPDPTHSETQTLALPELTVATKDVDVEACVLPTSDPGNVNSSQNTERHCSSEVTRKENGKGIRFWMIMLALVISFFLVIVDAVCYFASFHDSCLPDRSAYNFISFG